MENSLLDETLALFEPYQSSELIRLAEESGLNLWWLRRVWQLQRREPEKLGGLRVELVQKLHDFLSARAPVASSTSQKAAST